MTLELKAKNREVPTSKINQIRKTSLVPVEVYGHDQTNQHLWVEEAVLEKIYRQAGESSLVDLVIDQQQPIKIIIRELQHHPISSKIIHADLQAVRMDEEIETNVTLIFEGESKLIKEQGGTLIKGLEELNIKCLPADLIQNYLVRIDTLETFDDVIRVQDLKISDKIKIINEPETVVASIAPIHVEKEEPVAAPETPPEPELVGKEKKEGEEEAEVESTGKKEPAKPEKQEKK